MSMRITRRDWLRKGLVASGTLAFGAMGGLTPSMGRALYEEEDRIIYSPTFFEVKPPKMPDLSTLRARLHLNENPFGPSPKALEAFIKQAPSGNYYSWNHLMAFTSKVAEMEGVKPANIMMGPGSSDLLEKTALVTFMKGGGNIVSADPAYMSLVNVAQSVGGTWKPVKLTQKGFEHDLKEMEKAIDAQTKIVYITNPNNPTGTITDYEKLYKFVEKVSEKVLVFVDEAYLDLSDKGLEHSVVSLVAKGKNVIVSRTFSKIHGMAGIRVGYIVGLESTLKTIQDITRGGMGITGASIVAASASLDDKAFLTESKSRIKEARDFANDLVKSKGITPMPSQTNFVMFPIEVDGDAFLTKMYDDKVAVKVYKFWDKTWCRVSMGKMDEMKAFAGALDKALS